jgi:ubiquinone/menaquinone biosynthesis C-methylase UbiE
MLTTNDIDTWKAVATHDVDYHRRQFVQPYRSTMHLARFIRERAPELGGTALDVGCGAGANMYHLARELPGYSWTGVDIAGDVLFQIGREHIQAAGSPVEFLQGDFLDLVAVVAPRTFDLVVSIQTLLILPTIDYEKALDQLLRVTKGWLFITGLFTEHDVDVSIVARDYTWPERVREIYHYNVYALSRVRAFCEERGAREFIAKDFEIDVDLANPSSKGLGAYTRSLSTGQRLQFSGPIFQPWKFLAMRMGDL